MPEGWLTGWKDIAKYVGLSTRTCQRYERAYSFPVYFLPGGSPVALPFEIDQWLLESSRIERRKKK
jgi:hypothetical protein